MVSSAYNPNWVVIARELEELLALLAGSSSGSTIASVASQPNNWGAIAAALRNCITAAGGTPAVTYPPNPRGVILALQDLQIAIAAGGTVSTHVAAADPHTQYTRKTQNLADLGSATTARTNLGLGTIATQAANAVAITGGTITGITDLAIADGGTGAGTAAAARTNLGLGDIATQAANAVAITGGTITGITDLAIADGGTGAGTAAAARTNLGLGTIATQAANAVAITGGTVTGITDLAVADGGTGASDASTARTNLGLAIGTDVAAQSHVAANTNIHGLPASVAPLGDRTSSGRFIQTGSGVADSSLASYTLNSNRQKAITFPVAFSAVPLVLTNAPVWGSPSAAAPVSTTGCTLILWGDAALGTTLSVSYVAIGS